MLNYEGKQKNVLYSNITKSVGLRFFENHLYYFTSGGYVTKCRLYEKPRCENFKVHSYSSDLFTIMQNSLQPKLENFCENHTCTFMCVPSGLSYKCLCNDGTLIAKTDKCEIQKVINFYVLLTVNETLWPSHTQLRGY